uniref:Pyruvate:ferredoxin oxidoreductase n=1 Tax=Retortamonas sp. Vale TaxID=460175 RepID=B0F473_9EUKA|nr:pyruvate:ferredoxin oxidoreductase [Retortamonas sp. Vale]
MSVKFSPIDGNCAAAHTAYFFSDVSAIYPITPSSPMAEYIDSWASQGRLNAFGQIVRVEEMNSEAGAAGALHGSMCAGALTTTYTASQGLLLMIPNLYKIAGEHLPAVFHVAARTLATHALAIHGDHSDIMACRQTGVAMLMSSDVQEAMDLAIAAHIAAIKGSHPVMHAFDGFRTSHTIKKVELIDYERIRPFVPYAEIEKFRETGLNPAHPIARGSCMGPPVFMQAGEADNKHYLALPGVFEAALKDVEAITGRSYHLFDYIGHPEAEDLIILMGSGANTALEAVNYLTAKGEKVGAIIVHLYRPFSAEHFLAAMPKTVKRIAVLDRCKEFTASAEPLKLDVTEVLVTSGRIADIKRLIGGRYAQASKDFIPGDVLAIFKNLRSEQPLNHFTVGINDDVTALSLAREDCVSLVPEGTVQCMFFGMGSDGTVGANKNAIKIIADQTPLYAQGYFDYDSFKAGGFTTSHLRFGPKPITSEYYVYDADFTAVSQPAYWSRYNTVLVKNCKPGSILPLNSSAKTVEEVTDAMPKEMRGMIAAKKLRVKIMDASAIALKAGLPGRINSAMQTAFFLLSGVLPADDAIEIWKKTIIKTFSKKGEDVVRKNIGSVDATLEEGAIFNLEYPANWGEFADGHEVKEYQHRFHRLTDNAPAFIRDVFMPTCLGKGEELPASAFKIGGSMMTGTAKYAKRGIAVKVPLWDESTCIQCNQCVSACPHAVIRPYLVNAEEEEKLPGNVRSHLVPSKNMTAKEKGEFKFIIQPSPYDCTGCGVCVAVCPTAKKGTLKMELIQDVIEVENHKFEALDSIVANKAENWTIEEVCARPGTIGFRTPLFEYHGACAGCGETAYITQMCRLFGDRLIIANATGCSSIYGFSFPYSPYSTNSKGRGPAWGNSLFEDNAEFGYGMLAAIGQRRNAALQAVEKLAAKGVCADEAKAWMENFSKVEESETTGKALLEALKASKSEEEEVKYLLQPSVSELFPRPLILIQGGDGWAYDIGFGGVDHVLGTGMDITIMVLDTEVYSNTGGQCSHATPIGAVARFAQAGKENNKKDIGMIAMAYPNTYVASISFNANPRHALRCMREAMEWRGPSLLLCYSPCMEHGIIAGGLASSAKQQKVVVDTGYWLLYDRHPERGLELVSKKPTMPVADFLALETRFVILSKQKPERAADLNKKLQEFIDARFERYTKIAEQKI